MWIHLTGVFGVNASARGPVAGTCSNIAGVILCVSCFPLLLVLSDFCLTRDGRGETAQHTHAQQHAPSQPSRRPGGSEQLEALNKMQIMMRAPKAS